MSSGSSDTIIGSLKFKTRLCNCGKYAIVKVTENDKNRGRLYYVFPNGYCAIWDWCNSIGDNTRVEVGQRTRVQGRPVNGPDMNRIGQIRIRIRITTKWPDPVHISDGSAIWSPYPDLVRSVYPVLIPNLIRISFLFIYFLFFSFIFYVSFIFFPFYLLILKYIL